jgi:3-dehydroquinate synthase
MKTIKIHLPSGSMQVGIPRHEDDTVPKSAGRVSTIEIDRGVLSKLGQRLRVHALASKVFLVMSENIRRHYLDQIAASLDAESIDWEHIPIQDGDAEKTMAGAVRIIDELALRGAGRDSVVVTVGGGVTGDLAGFAASIYMRGIPLVQIPTTLLSQVDSSVGGKVGVNHPRAKNIIGNYFLPQLVLSDPCTLRTLPDAEISSGLAEVVKTAIIGSPALLDFIEMELSDNSAEKRRDLSFLERCIIDCVEIKASIVEKDLFDHHERRILNLGHTLGHALEAAQEFKNLSHGEAVSIGLIAAARIALSRGLVDEAFFRRLKDILLRCGLPVALPSYNDAAIAKSLYLDKKRRGNRFYFVLPAYIGSSIMAKIVEDVTEAEMLTALRKGLK